MEKVATPAPVFIPFFDQIICTITCVWRLPCVAGIGVEVYPEPKKLGQQLKYADRRGFRIALIAGENEFQAGTCQIKDLQQATKQDVPLEPDAKSVIAAVQGILTRLNNLKPALVFGDVSMGLLRGSRNSSHLHFLGMSVYTDDVVVGGGFPRQVRQVSVDGSVRHCVAALAICVFLLEIRKRSDARLTIGTEPGAVTELPEERTQPVVTAIHRKRRKARA